MGRAFDLALVQWLPETREHNSGSGHQVVQEAKRGHTHARARADTPRFRERAAI